MNSFIETILFSVVFLSILHFSSGRECFFDEGNTVIRTSLLETAEVDYHIRNFTSSKILEVPYIESNPYIELRFDEDGQKRLDIVLTTSLEDYFMDPAADQIITIALKTICDDDGDDISVLITVIDVNQPPIFELDDPILKIMAPSDPTIPINFATAVNVVDWDYDLGNSDNIIITTNNPLVRVEATKTWPDPTTRPRKYDLKLFLAEQIYEGLTFQILATDSDLDAVTQEMTIQVELHNVLPPKFENHFYKKQISGLPGQGDIAVDEIKINDVEGVPFEVTSDSDLIEIVESATEPGVYSAIFTRPLTPEDVLSFDHGVAIIEVTATEEIGANPLKSSTILVLFFNEFLATTTSATEGTTCSPITTEDTDTESTCPPCSSTTVVTEVTSVTCPETTSTACPETTTIFVESSSTACPEVTTMCPETSTICPECSTTTESETPVTCPDVTTICPETSSTDCTCEPCSTTEVSAPSSTECPEQTTVFVSTPCPDATTPSSETTPVTCQTEPSPPTDCPDVCATSTTETAISSSTSDCPEQSTIYVSTPCPEISTASTDCTSTQIVSETSQTPCVTTECPDVCTTTESKFGTTCAPCETCEDCSTTVTCVTATPVTTPTSTCSPCTGCETSTTSECPTPESCSDCETTGFIAALIALAVLFLLATAAAGYLLYKHRKAKNNIFSKLQPTPEPWIPEIVDDKVDILNAEVLPEEREYDRNVYAPLVYPVDPAPFQTTVAVESEPPIADITEPDNFGSRRTASVPELYQTEATNPLVETPTPSPATAAAVPAPTPEPPIPRPDYRVGVGFNELVEVFTPVEPEYEDDLAVHNNLADDNQENERL